MFILFYSPGQEGPASRMMISHPCGDFFLFGNIAGEEMRDSKTGLECRIPVLNSYPLKIDPIPFQSLLEKEVHCRGKAYVTLKRSDRPDDQQ